LIKHHFPVAAKRKLCFTQAQACDYRLQSFALQLQGFLAVLEKQKIVSE